MTKRILGIGLSVLILLLLTHSSTRAQLMAGGGVLGVRSSYFQTNFSMPFLRVGFCTSPTPIIFAIEYGRTPDGSRHGDQSAAAFGVTVGAKLYQFLGLEASVHQLSQSEWINSHGTGIDPVDRPGVIFNVFSLVIFPYKTSSISLGLGSQHSWRLACLIQLSGYKE